MAEIPPERRTEGKNESEQKHAVARLGGTAVLSRAVGYFSTSLCGCRSWGRGRPSFALRTWASRRLPSARRAYAARRLPGTPLPAITCQDAGSEGLDKAGAQAVDLSPLRASRQGMSQVDNISSHLSSTVEHRFRKAGVRGSNPRGGSSLFRRQVRASSDFGDHLRALSVSVLARLVLASDGGFLGGKTEPGHQPRDGRDVIVHAVALRDHLGDPRAGPQVRGEARVAGAPQEASHQGPTPPRGQVRGPPRRGLGRQGVGAPLAVGPKPPSHAAWRGLQAAGNLGLRQALLPQRDRLAASLLQLGRGSVGSHDPDIGI